MPMAPNPTRVKGPVLRTNVMTEVGSSEHPTPSAVASDDYPGKPSGDTCTILLEYAMAQPRPYDGKLGIVTGGSRG